MNRSPYGEPSQAIAMAREQIESQDTLDYGKTDTQELLGTSDEDNRQQKVWKKYVLDKAILLLPISLVVDTQSSNYQLSGQDRHTLSFVCSGLAPPFVA